MVLTCVGIMLLLINLHIKFSNFVGVLYIKFDIWALIDLKFGVTSCVFGLSLLRRAYLGL